MRLSRVEKFEVVALFCVALWSHNTLADGADDANRIYQQLSQGKIPTAPAGPKEYRQISIEDFVLDGDDLARKSANVWITGAYVRLGNIDYVMPDAVAVAMAREQLNLSKAVPLIADGAPRDSRKILLDCQSNPLYQNGCGLVLKGTVVPCQMQTLVGTKDTYCLAIDDVKPPV